MTELIIMLYIKMVVTQKKCCINCYIMSALTLLQITFSYIDIDLIPEETIMYLSLLHRERFCSALYLIDF